MLYIITTLMDLAALSLCLATANVVEEYSLCCTTFKSANQAAHRVQQDISTRSYFDFDGQVNKMSSQNFKESVIVRPKD